MTVENRGNGHTWRIKSPISGMSDIGDFIRRSWRSAKIAIAAPGTPGDFRRSPRSAYKIAKCVAGLILPYPNSQLANQKPSLLSPYPTISSH